VDSQSWPLEVKDFPQLSEKGAYSSESVYSLAETKDLIEFANARGIDVIIEFDTVSRGVSCCLKQTDTGWFAAWAYFNYP
jgi:hypothetical protein